MKFFLTMRNVVHVLKTDVPVVSEQKYDTEEALTKKYDIMCYLKYKMTDYKVVEPQFHEIQIIAHEIISESMPQDKQFQELKNLLKHKTKEFSLEYLITRLHIEEKARRQDRKDDVLIEQLRSLLTIMLRIRTAEHQPHQDLEPQKVQYANAKNDSRNLFICFKYWKSGHVARKYRNRPMYRPPQANMIDEPFVMVLSEVSKDPNSTLEFFYILF
ncbi:hypothetical protein Lal_00018731 [Lupinus albus]|nr:hypothetical protein Lal_00018731 [Lupinus albus]